MMKKSFLVLAFLCFLGGLVPAEESRLYNPPLEWRTPKLMGQGGSSTANVRGYEALFTNPAGLLTEKIEINILTLQPHWSLEPFRFFGNWDETGEFLEALFDQLTSHGVGAGVQTSLGFVGKGLGIAAFGSVNTYFPRSETNLGVDGDVMITFGLVGGYAMDFDLAEWTLRVGADVRPMYRYLANNISVKSVMGAFRKDSKAEGDNKAFPLVHGFGFGFDLGVQADYRFLTLGLAVRDIGTTFFYQNAEIPLNPFGDIKTLGSSYDKYATPTTLRLGAAVHPDLGELSKVIDPQAHAELSFPLVDDENYTGYKVGTPLTRLNIGAELKLLRFFALRTGLAGGYFTVGLGFDLPVFKLDFALYTLEKGTYAGNEPSMGGGIEISFRL